MHRLHLAWARTNSDDFHTLNALSHIGAVRLRMGDLPQAIRILMASLALRDRTGHRYAEAEVRNDLGIAYRGLGRLVEAQQEHELARRAVDRFGGATRRGGCAERTRPHPAGAGARRRGVRGAPGGVAVGDSDRAPARAGSRAGRARRTLRPRRPGRGPAALGAGVGDLPADGRAGALRGRTSPRRVGWRDSGRRALTSLNGAYRFLIGRPGSFSAVSTNGGGSAPGQNRVVDTRPLPGPPSDLGGGSVREERRPAVAPSAPGAVVSVTPLLPTAVVPHR